VSNSNVAYIVLISNNLRLLSKPFEAVQDFLLGVLIALPASISRLPGGFGWGSVRGHMNFQEDYDEAMFAFSRGDFAGAIAKLRAVLVADPAHFDAQLALGMAFYRQGDFITAIAEGHKAEGLRPKEQLVHTNLSLFYMKADDKTKAEHHGLQARIAGWRNDNAAAQTSHPGAQAAGDPELQMAKPKPPPGQVIRRPDKFPDQPWKKNPPVPSAAPLPALSPEPKN
jgi:tetratricopeptide (TPR) repeat protein